MFGACFGLAFSKMVSPVSARGKPLLSDYIFTVIFNFVNETMNKGHENNAAVYHSDLFAMVMSSLSSFVSFHNKQISFRSAQYFW